jgi:hypothetical protein
MTSTTIAYVHGLWFVGIEGHWLRRRIAGELAAEHRTFSYPSVTVHGAANVAALGKFLSSLRADVLHVVAHSLGGVLVANLFENPLSLPPGRVVLLGSPVNGSRAAQNLARIPGGRTILGRTVQDEVLPGRHRRWNNAHEVGVIAGASAHGLGRLLGKLDVPNDGTISVAETDLPGATDQIVLPVSHSGMLFSALAAKQAAAFLRDGRFAA